MSRPTKRKILLELYRIRQMPGRRKGRQDLTLWMEIYAWIVDMNVSKWHAACARGPEILHHAADAGVPA